MTTRGGGRRGRLRVALVGADGAGKTTISRMLERAALPAPVKRIYMGVNLESSSLMLPTTRLLVAAKRARGGRPDLVGTPSGTVPHPRPSTWRRSARSGARMTVWILEEWLRQVVAWWYSRAGYLVVFDRHFIADYHHSNLASARGGREPVRSLHGWLLRHVYPRPDLVVCLDAPGRVLWARKPESDLQTVEERRLSYLELDGIVPAFVVVDADRPLDAVLDEVLETIRHHWLENAS